MASQTLTPADPNHGFEPAIGFSVPGFEVPTTNGTETLNPLFGLNNFLIEDYQPARRGLPILPTASETDGIPSVSESEDVPGSLTASVEHEISYHMEREGHRTPYTWGERFFGEQCSTAAPRAQTRWAAYVLGRPHLALTPLVEVEPLEEAQGRIVPLKREALSAFRQKWYTRAREQFRYSKYGTAEILQIDCWLRREMALDTSIHPSTVASQAPRIAAIAALPNRDDIAALRTWKSPEAQSLLRDARRAVKYSWWDRLLGRERPPSES